jgi:hypothetical protein
MESKKRDLNPSDSNERQDLERCPTRLHGMDQPGTDMIRTWRVNAPVS